MDKIERMKLVKAMEMIARCVNNEEVFDIWLSLGVPDGDIKYGDLTVTEDDIDPYYCGAEGWWSEEEANEHLAELMHLFLEVMHDAREDGGLYCDDVVSK